MNVSLFLRHIDIAKKKILICGHESANYSMLSCWFLYTLNNIIFAKIKYPRIFYYILTNFIQRGQIWNIWFASRSICTVAQQRDDPYNPYALRVRIWHYLQWYAAFTCSSLATSSLNIFRASTRVCSKEDMKKYTYILLNMRVELSK